MKLIKIVLLLLLGAGLLWFIMENVDSKVDLWIFGFHYNQISLYLVVFGALFIGILIAGFIGLAEGAHDRMVNRRLTRDLRKLETEVNFLRTQPPGPPRQEPDELPDRRRLSSGREGDDTRDRSPASAPVYGADENDWQPDDDDDVYSGGRAV